MLRAKHTSSNEGSTTPRFAAPDHQTLFNDYSRLLQTVDGLGRAESREIRAENKPERYSPTVTHLQERQHLDSPRLTLPTIFNDYSRQSSD
jgi:hypothetical protein